MPGSKADVSGRVSVEDWDKRTNGVQHRANMAGGIHRRNDESQFANYANFWRPFPESRLRALIEWVSLKVAPNPFIHDAMADQILLTIRKSVLYALPRFGASA